MIQENDGSFAMPCGARARMTEAGNVLDIMAMEHWPSGSPITKLDKDQYMVNATGEVKAFVHHEDRTGNIREVQKTFVKLRALINANCASASDIRMLTLTYRENMQDLTQLYNDFKSFWKRLQRYLVRVDVMIPEYISVAEPQGRGAWHLHCILIWSSGAPAFLDFREVGELWGHGWVHQTLGKGVQTCDNLGAYFGAYLANMPETQYYSLPDSDKVVKGKIEVMEGTYYCDGEEVTKKFVKNARLALYKSGANIFRHSRGCKKPVVEDMRLSEAIKKAGAATPTFSRCYDVLDDAERSVNHILKMSYNKRRAQTR